MPFRTPSSLRAAFTLIELLTVIAIIGILAAIIIPVVGKVRDSARDSNSRSNLRQIGMTNQLYAQENKGITVPGKGPNPSNPTAWAQWQVLLSKFTEGKVLAGDWEINQDAVTGYKAKSFFAEPKWTESAPGWSAGPNESGFGLNMRPTRPTDAQSDMDWSWNSNAKSRVNLNTINSPSRRIFAAVWTTWNMFPTTSATQANLINASARYNSRKISAAYFDGHISKLDPVEFHAAINQP